MRKCWRQQRTTPREVGSVQRIALGRPVVDSTPEGARELGTRYWNEIARCTHGVVRAHVSADEVLLVLAGRVTLFRFGPPEPRVDPHRVECRYRIVGGLLVARPGGSVSAIQRTEPKPLLELAVRGYQPRLMTGRGQPLRRFLYTTVQAPLHVAVGRRFLAREAAGCQ
jgi:hypothetical protein